MELVKNEIRESSNCADQFLKEEILDLSEAQLNLIGGGIGDVIVG